MAEIKIPFGNLGTKQTDALEEDEGVSLLKKQSATGEKVIEFENLENEENEKLPLPADTPREELEDEEKERPRKKSKEVEF